MDASKLDMTVVDEFFKGIIGRTCWSVSAGPGTGSMVSLYIGEKIRRARPHKNPALTGDQREFDTEFDVFIKDASWQVIHGNKVICTNDDSNDFGGPMLAGLQRLVGRSIASASIVDDSGSARIDFDDDLGIRICCKCEIGWDSYVLFHLGEVVAEVSCKGPEVAS